jgi:hypothetical protein
MQRAKHAAARATAAAATEEALVVPLLQLVRSADDANGLMRLPRALELYERALVLAETTMPESTLLTAALLQQVINKRMAVTEGAIAAVRTNTAAVAALHKAAWRGDEQLLRLSRRGLGLLRARWAAGTLLTPTPQELCFYGKFSDTPELLGVELFAGWAVDALMYWPHASPTFAGSADCLRGIHEALRAVLAMQSMRQTRTIAFAPTALNSLSVTLHVVLTDASWLERLRTACGLSHADETELRKLHQELEQSTAARFEICRSTRDAIDARGAADVARHGLRSCALPSCNSAEPAPKTYKLCGRCRGVAYCCAAHSKEDWKRHKREDGCAAPPS